MSTRRQQKRLAAAGARRYWLIWLAVAPVVVWALVRLCGGWGIARRGSGGGAAQLGRYRPDLLAVQELTPSFARELRRAGFDRRLGIVDYAVEELPGSDHRPVWAELALP